MDRGDHGLHETGHRFVAMNHIETKLFNLQRNNVCAFTKPDLYHLALYFALHLELPGSCTLALFD